MKSFQQHGWPDGVTWQVSVKGRVLTYEFAHSHLGELGRIVIRPVEKGLCHLECQYVGSGDAALVAERKAKLISLGEYITSVFAERHRQKSIDGAMPLRRVH